MVEKYVNILKNDSLKITPQRLEILKFLDNHKTHPTVDEIYKELKVNNPSLSKTTVYNSVEVLESHGIIQSISISPNEKRYEFNNQMHHHFLCKKCSRIIDIEIKCPNINRVIDQGHDVEEVHGYFKGICKDCIDKGQ
jgi:Fe2+ or Zn2+ uptake regulation protein